MANKGIKSLWGYPLIDEKGRSAIDSVRSNLENNFQKKTDDTLGTTDKTVPGAINEIKNNIDSIGDNFTSEKTETKYDMKYNGKSIGSISIGLEEDQIAGGDGSFNIDLTPYQTKNDDTLTTTNKTIIGGINEVNAQCNDIAHYSLVKHTDGKVYIKKTDGTLVGSGVEVGNGVDLGTLSMNINGQTLKLLNDTTELATVTIPKMTDATEEELTTILQGFITDGTLSALTIEDNSIVPKKIKGCTQLAGTTTGGNSTKDYDESTSVNQFNKLKATKDYVVSVTQYGASEDGGLVSLPNENYYVSNFIKVDSNTSYKFTGLSKGVRVIEYDDNKKYIKYIENTGVKSDLESITTSNSTMYIRVNFIVTDYPLDTYMVCKSSEYPSDYVAYVEKNTQGAREDSSDSTYKYDWLKIERDNILGYMNDTKLIGKKFHLFGDSITYWDDRYAWADFDTTYFMKAFPTHMREKLGVTTVNHGVAGAQMSSICNNVKSTDLTDVHAITLMGGTNDCLNNVSIETYKNSIISALDYCFTNYPYMKVYMISPLKLFNQTNSENISNYCDAMEEVGLTYGVPTLRLDKLLQINSKNYTTLTVEGIHPKNEGHTMIADLLIPFILNH